MGMVALQIGERRADQSGRLVVFALPSAQLDLQSWDA